MLKKLQALKAKKGFTLVELIVVIAIIGVLAAILIPTMLGYVTSSRVTSANSTAASIQKEVNNWLTSMDSKGVGAKKLASATTITMTFAKDNTGGITTDKSCETADIAALYVTASWNVKGSVCTDGASLENNFEAYLGDLLPDASGSALVVIWEGKCIGCVWTPDSEAGITNPPAADDVKAIVDIMQANNVGTFAGWGKDNHGTNGISEDGSIYGTSPVFENPVQ